MKSLTFDKGVLVDTSEIPGPPPDPRRVAIEKVPTPVGALALALFLFLSGCGMFGDTAFYQAMGAACMKCHAGGNVPTKQNLKPETGVKGEAGTKVPGCPMDCPFANGR